MIFDVVFANNLNNLLYYRNLLKNTILSHNLFPDSYCVFHGDRDYY
jgi:hypothetical protein